MKTRANVWLIFLMGLLLTGCADSRVSLSEQQFQGMIDQGFQAPRIITVNLPAAARAQLYLQTPQVRFSDSREYLDWSVNGEVDLDIADHFTSGRMTLSLRGKAALNPDAGQKTVALSKVSVVASDIDLQSSLIQVLVLDKLAQLVAEQLNGLLLFSVSDKSPLAPVFSDQVVNYQIEPGHILFSPSRPAKPGL